MNFISTGDTSRVPEENAKGVVVGLARLAAEGHAICNAKQKWVP